jgi:hypothetical protein
MKRVTRSSSRVLASGSDRGRHTSCRVTGSFDIYQFSLKDFKFQIIRNLNLPVTAATAAVGGNSHQPRSKQNLSNANTFRLLPKFRQLLTPVARRDCSCVGLP